MPWADEMHTLPEDVPQIEDVISLQRQLHDAIRRRVSRGTLMLEQPAMRSIYTWIHNRWFTVPRSLVVRLSTTNLIVVLIACGAPIVSRELSTRISWPHLTDFFEGAAAGFAVIAACNVVAMRLALRKIDKGNG